MFILYGDTEPAITITRNPDGMYLPLSPKDIAFFMMSEIESRATAPSYWPINSKRNEDNCAKTPRKFEGVMLKFLIYLPDMIFPLSAETLTSSAKSHVRDHATQRPRPLSGPSSSALNDHWSFCLDRKRKAGNGASTTRQYAQISTSIRSWQRPWWLDRGWPRIQIMAILFIDASRILPAIVRVSWSCPE